MTCKLLIHIFNFILERVLFLDTNVLYQQAVDQFFSLQLPMRVPQLNGLVSGLDNALQAYTQRVVSQLGNFRFMFFISSFKIE